MGDKVVNEQAEKVDEMERMLASLGDEPITLMDEYERLSFEVQLNQAMLGRSLSESCAPRTQLGYKPNPISLPLPPVASHTHQEAKQKRPQGLRFRKVLSTLLKPFSFRASGRKEIPDAKHPNIWKAFSKSMRV